MAAARAQPKAPSNRPLTHGSQRTRLALPVASLGAALATVRGRLDQHPDAAALVLISIVALALRLAFAFRAPVFVLQDSIAYVQTGYDFTRLGEFDLPYKRAPLYPLFIAAVVSVLGPQLEAIGFVQHVVGVLSAVLTYLLGRAIFGRLAGLLAGLLVAVSGQLIILEHYLLAESLFVVLLLGFALSLTLGGQRRSWRWLVLAGVLLGLASLTRSVAMAILPLVPPILLLAFRSWRAMVRGSALVALGVALVALPWMTRNQLTYGAFEIAGGSGQHLVARVSRNDERLVIPTPDSPSPYADPVRTEARALILRQMARDARPSAINHRLIETYGWGDVEANRAMREVALEIIAAQREAYVAGTLAKARRVVWGERESIYGDHWATRRGQELHEAWTSNASIAHLLTPPSPFQEAEKANAERIIRLFSPADLRGPLGLLLLVGLVVGLHKGRRWATLFLVLVILALIVPSTAVVGYLPRYRYPADPFFALLIGAGLAALLRWPGSRAAVLFRRVQLTSRGDELAPGRAREPVAGALAHR